MGRTRTSVPLIPGTQMPISPSAAAIGIFPPSGTYANNTPTAPALGVLSCGEELDRARGVKVVSLGVGMVRREDRSSSSRKGR